jgi:hypothetical protein
VKENEVGVGIMGANLRVRRRAKVFREEIESETKERHLTRPSNVFGTGWKLKEEGRSAVPEGHLTCPQTPFSTKREIAFCTRMVKKKKRDRSDGRGK